MLENKFYIECCDGVCTKLTEDGPVPVAFDTLEDAEAFARQIFHDGDCGRFPCAVAKLIDDAFLKEVDLWQDVCVYRDGGYFRLEEAAR